MVIMALDHTRDYFSNARFDPLDLSQTTLALYLTRWVTHFCAPVFIFLAGTGAYLSLARGKTKRELSRFLWTRGLWLVIVEVTIVSFGWSFDPLLHLSVLQVIWAIGWSMVVLAALVRLPTKVVGTAGVVMIAGHNLLDPIRPEQLGAFDWFWRILHVSSWTTPLAAFHGHTFMLIYPLIPWVGVMAAGYAFGALFSLGLERRRRVFLALGVCCIAVFGLLRASNLYGDLHRWSVQKNGLWTALSFFDCEKYPPSLLYLLVTLGPALLLLAYLRDDSGPVGRKVVVFGRVPFFYYVLHIPLIHAMAALFFYLKYGPASLTYGIDNPPPAGFGLGLPGVYFCWGVAILILYFPCRWFAGLKQRNKAVWLSYL
jgi:uncharacterized membrane protein